MSPLVILAVAGVAVDNNSATEGELSPSPSPDPSNADETTLGLLASPAVPRAPQTFPPVLMSLLVVEVA